MKVQNIVILTLIICLSFVLGKNERTKKNTPAIPIQNINYTPNNILDFRPAARIGTKAVVHVTGKKQDLKEYIYFDQFFGLYDYQTIPQYKYTSGSGVILSEDGYIITNNHVVEGFQEVSVSLHNGEEYLAKVVASDPSTDLSLLKIKEKNLHKLNFGNSDKVEVGQWVLAIGNPLNLNSTVTSGIISAKARNINILRKEYAIESFLQTDAAVNPGNSGGALIDLNGNLIGINTAIASTTGAYSGYSFAIPSNIVNKVYNDLLKYGLVQRAFLGIYIQEMNPKLSKDLNIEYQPGIYVNGYTANSNAESAGIRKGDIINKIDGVKISKISELQQELMQKNPGMKAKVSVIRKGKEEEFEIQLTNKKGGIDLIKKS